MRPPKRPIFASEAVQPFLRETAAPRPISMRIDIAARFCVLATAPRRLLSRKQGILRIQAAERLAKRAISGSILGVQDRFHDACLGGVPARIGVNRPRQRYSPRGTSDFSARCIDHAFRPFQRPQERRMRRRLTLPLRRLAYKTSRNSVVAQSCVPDRFSGSALLVNWPYRRYCLPSQRLQSRSPTKPMPERPTKAEC